MYVIAIVAISVAWSSTKVIQRNYRLQKQVSQLQQELDVVRLEVDNQKLQNEYYKSDAFLELSAKRQLNKAAPGEKLIIVPKELALSKVGDLPAESTQSQQSSSGELSNWQAWFEFLSGRSLSD